MQGFTFHVPTEIAFGKGAADNTARLVKKYGGSRVLLVYGGQSALKSGLVGAIKKQLEATGLAVSEFGGVTPNPALEKAREGVRQALAFKADFILAIGGGSAIDAAKAAAHGAANPGIDIWKFWTKEAQLTASLPVGCILTISAAGSETSNSAVLTNTGTGEKRGLSTELNRPRFSIMDPSLTYTVPPYHTACGTADIMMHTTERFFTPSKEQNEMTDEIAVSLLRVVIRNGRKILKNPCDYDAASELMWCGSLSHNGITALGRPVDFPVHQMGHELSAMFDAAHGASLTAVWGAWADYCTGADVPRFAYYARKVWDVREKDDVKAAAKGIEKTVAYFKSMGLPVNIAGLGHGKLDAGTIKKLAYACSYKGTRTVCCFKPLGVKELEEVYALANKD